ncbi:hypothetical protein F5Y18DRAFT_127662 [Xylariaceae sp. FL1019]|nr:hypothetical protein F5Y18DRAFT_127662 [Xylariaceae sp. FL1019]
MRLQGRERTKLVYINRRPVLFVCLRISVPQYARWFMFTMKFALPSKLYYALAHHTHSEQRRSKSDSLASSRSSKSWPYDYSHSKPQIICGSWVNGDKLKELLNRKFGSNYRLQVRVQSPLFINLPSTSLICPS